MEVGLLGPLELAESGRPIAFGGVRQKAVLALLVLHANQVVPSERLLLEPTQDVEFRFMIVQNNVVVEGTGRGRGGSGRWSGETDRGQERLEESPALAIGLAFLARKEPGRGYETFTWSGQIELKRQGRNDHDD